MLSVCIPIYNFEVTGLVESLHIQAINLDIPCEIICIDDCSDKPFRIKNEEICNKYAKYVVLPNNIGRAKIRNLFLSYAVYDYLLFIDCDSIIISDNFLSKYAECIKDKAFRVICGGRVYDTIKPPRQNRLRWKYGHLKESKACETRQNNPYRSFMTNNFVIYKNTLTNIRFDESLSYYGHEDTLFGFQLMKNNVKVKHIDNPVLNGQLETNREYIEKTELGLKNLVNILHRRNCDPDFINEVTILKFYKKTLKMHISKFIAVIFTIIRPFIKMILSSGIINLMMFDFYKLGFLTKTERTLH